MSQKIKTVAVIGCGKSVEGQVGWAIGHEHGKGYRNCGQAVRLQGVDLSEENLQAFAEKFEVAPQDCFLGTDALYAAGIPDIVSICTWPGLHAPMAIEAMEKGVKGLVIEKPLALNVGEIRAIQQKAEETGAVVCVAHQRRLEPYFQKMKEVIQSGRLGEKLRVDAHIGDGWDILSWTTHWFDMANFMFGGAPKSVLAGMDLNDKRLYGHAAEDDSVIYADYGDAGEAVFVTGASSGSHFRVIGSLGMAQQHANTLQLMTEAGCEVIELAANPGSFGLLFAELIEAMDSGAAMTCSLASCAAATEMAYAAHEAARTGKKVALPLTVDYAPLELYQHASRSTLAGQRAVLYADQHFGSGGREGLAEAIEALTGVAPKVIDADENPLTAADLEGADALYLYHTQAEVALETEAALTAWVAAAKPLALVHAALGGWPKWEAYQKWCGIIWEWGVSIHPYEPAALAVTAGNPLGLTYSQAWLPKDEVFVKLKEVEPVQIGVTTKLSDGATYPVAWRSVEFPNIGIWMPGHLRSSWQVPAMRTGLEQLVQAIV